MRTSVIAILLLAPVLSFAGPICRVYGSGSIDGTNYVQILSGAGPASWPSWNPETEECPLSPHQAVGIARSALRASFPRTGRWLLDEIHLRRTNQAIWLYSVRFIPPDYDSLSPSNRLRSILRVVLTLNGTVPQIITEEQQFTRMKESKETPNQ